MPTITYTTLDVRTGGLRNTLQDKVVTLFFDGVKAGSAEIQFLRPNCPNPNFENYMTASGKPMAQGGVAYALTYVMLKEVLATKFRTATVKSAHGGVMALLNCRFIIVSESRQFKTSNGNKTLVQCDMVSHELELAAGYCAQKLEAKYAGLVLP
jgi:hypothetical protein